MAQAVPPNKPRRRHLPPLEDPRQGTAEIPASRDPAQPVRGTAPVVALVGRQNVGKSTLFNKLFGRRKAIVYDFPGVTRDRNEAVCSYRDRFFTLVDMAGFTSDGENPTALCAQFARTVRAADYILFIMDAKEGLTPADQELYDQLRRTGRPVYIVINKTEGRGGQPIEEFYKLGQGPLYPISAEHNLGLSDLLDALYPFLGAPPCKPPLAAFPSIPKIAVIGRPNTGKSTLINTLLKEERLVTSNIPGTTRDTIDTQVSHKGREYLFIDTAGIRKRGKVVHGVEQYAVARAKEALAWADIALLLIDGACGITEQDTKLAGIILKGQRGLVPLVSKSDLLNAEDRARICRQFDLRFPFLKGVPVRFISGKTGAGLATLFKTIDQVYARFYTHVPTPDLNRFLTKITQAHPPPVVGKKRAKIYYATQAGTAPPLFCLFAHAADIPTPYRHYIENCLRERFGLVGVPIRMMIR